MAKEYTPLEQNRIDKLTRLVEQGINPYPHRVARTHTSRQAIQAYEAFEQAGGEDAGLPAVEVALAGRLRSSRTMGKVTFAHIEDGDGRIQLFLRANDVGQEPLQFFNREFDLGDFVTAQGHLFRTKSGEISLWVKTFQLAAKAITPLPAAKDEIVDGEMIRHAGLTDPETRYRQRYADLAVNPDVREIFRKRAAVVRSLRTFMDNHGFLEVETPILQPIYGGAAARPFITHHNQLKQQLFLRISFELYLKRLLVGGLERVYEIGRDFRNEGVDRTHNPEFTQLEFYWAYADYNMVMGLTEQMLAFVADQVLGTRQVPFQGHILNFDPPWQRLEMKQAVRDMAGIDLDAYPDAASLAALLKSRGISTKPNSPRGKLIDAIMGEYVEPNLIQPTFIYNYPRDISPLAKSMPGDPNWVERFEGYVAGFELCNAFTELNDPQDQEARFREMGRDYEANDEEQHPMDEDYLQAMRYGMPPNGGFGMGVDRLAMVMTDTPNIREVLLFPHLRKTDDDTE